MMSVTLTTVLSGPAGITRAAVGGSYILTCPVDTGVSGAVVNICNITQLQGKSFEYENPLGSLS